MSNYEKHDPPADGDSHHTHIDINYLPSRSAGGSSVEDFLGENGNQDQSRGQNAQIEYAWTVADSAAPASYLPTHTSSLLHGHSARELHLRGQPQV